MQTCPPSAKARTPSQAPSSPEAFLMEHLERTALRQQNQENRKIRAPRAVLPPSHVHTSLTRPWTNSSCSSSTSTAALCQLLAAPKGKTHELLSASSCWYLRYNAGLKLHSSLPALTFYFDKRALQSPRIQCRGQGSIRSTGPSAFGLQGYFSPSR